MKNYLKNHIYCHAGYDKFVVCTEIWLDSPINCIYTWVTKIWFHKMKYQLLTRHLISHINTTWRNKKIDQTYGLAKVGRLTPCKLTHPPPPPIMSNVAPFKLAPDHHLLEVWITVFISLNLMVQRYGFYLRVVKILTFPLPDRPKPAPLLFYSV